jgi:hypothetical protein
LTGERAAIQRDAKAVTPSNDPDLPWSNSELATLEDCNGQYDVKNDLLLAGTSTCKAFKGDPGKIGKWYDWMKRAQLDVASWFGDLDYARGSGEYVKETRVDVVVGMLKGFGMDTGLEAEMSAYLGQFYPGRRGTGKYSERQIACFDRLAESVASQKPAAVSTPERIAEAQKEGAGMSGEATAKGLVAQHQYAVLDTKEEHGLRWVQLRNPWGSYGGKYGWPETDSGGDNDAGQGDRQLIKGAQADVGGTFWLELSDLSKRFPTEDLVL